ncbi:hypothetical protein BDZ89DRAFT_1039242 [Hymenopellis radicata]|nr:hypothetical protein BDZ89DRAFT_1039242 [Hymenopellis radicata]
MPPKRTSSRKNTPAPPEQSSPATTPARARTTGRNSTIATVASPPANTGTPAASTRQAAQRKEKAMDSISSNLSKNEMTPKAKAGRTKAVEAVKGTPTPASKLIQDVLAAEVNQSAAGGDEKETPPEQGLNTMEVKEEATAEEAEVVKEGAREETMVDDDTHDEHEAQPVEANNDGLASQDESEEEGAPTPQPVEETDEEGDVDEGEELGEQPKPSKGKGKAHDPVEVVDEFGEQLEMDAEESIQLRMQKDAETVHYTTIMERRALKEKALLKATQDEENSPVEAVFGEEAANSTKLPAPRLASHPDYAPVVDSKGRRVVEWNAPYNIYRKNLAPATIAFFGKLAMRDPYALVFITLGVTYRSNAIGNHIKELRRALADFKVNMANVEIHPFRSSLEQGISYDDDDDTKAVKDTPDGESDVDMDEKETVISQTVDWSRVREDSLPAPGFMVTGLEPEDSEFFADMALLIHRTGLSFGALDIRSHIPTHLLTISDFTLDDSPEDVAVGKAIIENTLRASPKFRQFVATHRDRLPAELTDEEAIEVTITSTQYRPLFMGGNAHYQAGFKGLGHIDAPFLNPVLLGLFALIINSLLYKGKNGKGGIGVVGRPFACGRCSATDHPTGYCFVTKLVRDLNAKQASFQSTSKIEDMEESKGTDDLLSANAMEVDPFAALPRSERERPRPGPSSWKKRAPTTKRGGDQNRRRK